MHGLRTEGLPWKWILAKSTQLEQDLLARRLAQKQAAANRGRRIKLTR